ncbi:MAG: hypothetical protein OHK0017_05960 [Patescibacteria group bacterium]
MLKLVFASSSDFTIPILKSILQSEGQTLANITRSQVKYLSMLDIDQHFLDNLKSLDQQLDLYPEFSQTIKLAVVITQAARLNRGKEILNPIHTFASEHKLEVFSPEKLNHQVDTLIEYELDLGIVASYGQILSTKVLQSSNFGWINWHPSLLPQYRGPTPMQTALLNGDAVSGLSWIEMTKGMDSGDLLLQIKQNLDLIQTIKTLSSSMGELGGKTWAIAASLQILNRNLENQSSNLLKLAISQNEPEATFCHMLNKEDRLSDYRNSSAEKVLYHWRAMLFFPGTVLSSEYFKQEIKLLECDLDYIKALSRRFEGEASLSEQNPLRVSGMLNPDQIYGEFYKDKNQVFIICQGQTLLPVKSIQLLESGQKINLSGYNFK